MPHLPDTQIRLRKQYGDMFGFFWLLVFATQGKMAAKGVHWVEFFPYVKLQNSYMVKKLSLVFLCGEEAHILVS